jgi:uncharacterized protein (DUF924 family)
MQEQNMSRIEQILDFWFHPDESVYGKLPYVWFLKNDKFDEVLRTRFLADYELASSGQLNHWQNSPRSCLALILLLDQLPRNLFRGQPQAFATDNQALKIASYAINNNFDQQLDYIERWFIYLPFEHSENLEDQHRCVELFQQLSHDPNSAQTISFAERHLEIIKRFGRFPHRNQIIGRTTTPEEAQFLKEANSSF